MAGKLRTPEDEDLRHIQAVIWDYAACQVVTLTGSAQAVSGLGAAPIVRVRPLGSNAVWCRGDGTAAAVATAGSLGVEPGTADWFNPTASELSIIGTADDTVEIGVPQTL